MKARLLLLSVLVVSCTGKPAPSGPVTAPGPAAPAAATMPAVPPPSVSPPAPVRPFDESLLRGREFLLEAQGPGGAKLRDPVVGPLGADGELAAAVTGFFTAAGADRLDAATLVPRWADDLRSWAARARASGLEVPVVHAGEALPERQGETLVPVHVRSGTKEWKGWVAMRRGEGTWLVSDVQTVEVDPPVGPFDPESGGQEISSPSRR